METIIERDKDKVKDEEPTLILDEAKKLSLSPDQEDRLKEEIKDEFEAIESERMAEHLDSFFDSMDNQYKGKMPRRKNAMFNLNDPLTKRIINDVVGSIVEAHWGVDPIVSVSPRPEFAKEGGNEVCEKQEQFIDYAFDVKIPFKSEFELAAFSASTKRVGVIKWFHKIKF